MRRGRLLAATAAVFTGALGLLVATHRALGVSRDEAIYIEAAGRYARWLAAAVRGDAVAWTAQDLQSPYAWGYNHEHPALIKVLAALSSRAAHGWLGIDELTALRLPAMALSAAMVALVFAWGARVWSPRAGGFAALALVAMPRVFYHAHLVAFDAPVAALWTVTLACYARAGATGARRWSLAAGIAFGLALDTKLSALFLPAVVGLHVGWLAATGARGAALSGARTLGVMLAVGPVVLIALWPWLWVDPWGHLVEYVGFHWRHAPVETEHLGVSYLGGPYPRSYLPVMIAATVPTTTLVLAAIGGGAAIRDGAGAGAVTTSRGTAVLWLAAIAVALAPWLSPMTPIHGGTKHWLPAYPFLALFAGRGFVAVRAWLARGGGAATVAIAAALAAPAVAQTVHARRFPLTAYTPLVGGAAGAADLGLRRQYWSYAVPAGFPAVDALAPAGGRVFVDALTPTLWPLAARWGALRGDLARATLPWDSDVAVVAHELHTRGVEYRIWEAYGAAGAAEVVALDGVPVVSVYRRPRAVEVSDAASEVASDVATAAITSPPEARP